MNARKTIGQKAKHRHAESAPQLRSHDKLPENQLVVDYVISGILSRKIDQDPNRLAAVVKGTAIALGCTTIRNASVGSAMVVLSAANRVARGLHKIVL